MSEGNMIIVGAGHAGVMAALEMRSQGYVGNITMIAEDSSDAPYEKPPLSKWKTLIKESSTLIGAQTDITSPIVPADILAAANIVREKALVSHVHPANHTVELADGRKLTFDRLLLATGASARMLNVSNEQNVPVFYLRSKSDALVIRKAANKATSATIIGGGFIGLELAASLRQSGISVHIVEAADRLLVRAISSPVASIVHQLHVAHGVDFTFSAAIHTIKKRLHATSGGTLVLENGHEIDADLIIAGIGSLPEITLAEQAGLIVKNGVVVDKHLRTSNANIYSAGDCCSFPLYGNVDEMIRLESWKAAGELGAIAGKNMVSNNDRTDVSMLMPWFWTEQYDHVLQVAGLPIHEMEQVQRTYSDTHHLSFGLDTDGSISYACGIAPGLKIAKDIRFAMKLIDKGSPIAKEALKDQTVSIKSLC